MAKTKISEYSATAANNTDVESVNIAEGCAPSGINNAIREVMSHLKDFQTGSAGDDLTVGGNFSVTGTVTIPDNAISGDKVEGGTINAITINTLSANPTLSAGTANGVTYLNGSKVLTSGSALTFAGTSLGLNGASANILFDNGGVSGSSLQLGTSGSSHGYIGTVGSFPLLFQVNGVEAMRIGLATGGLRTVGIGYTSLTSVGDNGLAVFGNVGIGTNSPAEKLEVAGNIKLNTTSPNLYFTVSSGTKYNWMVAAQENIDNCFEITPSTTAGGSTFSTPAVVINSSGNLGLGVTPSAWVAGYKVLQVGNASWYTDGNANIYLAANTYQASGFVDTYISSNEAAKYEQINGAHRWFNAPSGTAGNAISFTQAMTLNSNGALCINRTDQQNDERLAVFGNVGQQCMSLKSPITTAYDMINIINGNGQVGTIQTNGSATSYNTSSDYRLKENVVTEWDATTRLKQLKPSRFNFIADADTTVDGFLAHEVQEIVPEAITGTKDAVDADGNPKYQGIDQSKLVPLLVKTIQEQQAIIESLTARVSALEGN
jgi:hypothetical protein